jgi:hypothetical protein
MKSLFCLVAALGLVACASRPARPTLAFPASALRGKRTVKITTLAYHTARHTGAVDRRTITIEPSHGEGARLLLAESRALGVNNEQRAAMWLAGYAAAAAIGRSLDDYRITVSVPDRAAGPSAGMLYAAAMMAAMCDLPLRADATLTGVILPDGVVGMVGGIPEKLLAAIRAGKKRIGYPVGQRRYFNRRTRSWVDLEQLARSHGAEAVSLTSIYDAFELLTGVSYPRPFPVLPAEMKLTPSVNASLLRQSSRLRREGKTIITTLAGRALRARARRRVAIASRSVQVPLGRDGVAAFVRLWSALPRLTRLLAWQRYRAQTTFGARVRLTRALRARFLARVNTYDAEKGSPGLVALHRHVLLARKLAVARVFSMQGDRAFAAATTSANRSAGGSSSTTEPDVAKRRYERRLARAHGAYLNAINQLFALEIIDAFPASGGAGYQLRAGFRLARSWERQASAILGQFEATLPRRPQARARAYLRPQLRAARLAKRLSSATRALSKATPKSESDKIEKLAVLLGCSMEAYLRSAVTNYRMMRPMRTGAYRRIANAGAWPIVDYSERLARMHARLAKQVSGHIPQMAKLYYRLGTLSRARIGRRVGFADHAIRMFRTSSLLSQINVQLLHKGR